MLTPIKNHLTIKNRGKIQFEPIKNQSQVGKATVTQVKCFLGTNTVTSDKCIIWSNFTDIYWTILLIEQTYQKQVPIKIILLYNFERRTVAYLSPLCCKIITLELIFYCSLNF